MAWGTASAQSTAAANPRYLLTAPLYDGAANSPYDLNVAPVQNGPPGTVLVTPAAPSADYSFTEFTKNIHGYVSAGVATHDGHNFSGAVTMPLVPGKVDLAIAAASGQQGGFLPVVPGGKRSTLRYDAYQVSLHLHPTDDVDAYIGLTGADFHGPVYGSYFGRGAGYPFPH